MNNKDKQKKLIVVLFIAYLVILVATIFLKVFSATESVAKQVALGQASWHWQDWPLFTGQYREFNLDPLVTIRLFLDSLASGYNLHLALTNILGNILPFLPLGYFATCLFHKKGSGLLASLVWGLVISSMIELGQLFTGWGVLDIDDIILNTFGALLGWLIYKLYLVCKPQSHRVRSR